MKNKYEKLFDEFISITDFRLVKYMDGFGLIDLQGADLGEIESDRGLKPPQIFLIEWIFISTIILLMI